jgi:Mrp family chromosome partitioning ATPase
LNKKSQGLTSYLAAQEDELTLLDKYIISSDSVEGLDILLAGIVPPNPAELLSGTNLDRAMEYLRGKYDYIILDGPPVGLVSDSLIISRVADIVAYVVRLDYTHKADARFIMSLVAEKKLENLSIVVNAEDLKKKNYGSYYGSHYGSYYGSGRYSSYGYTENE